MQETELHKKLSILDSENRNSLSILKSCENRLEAEYNKLLKHRSTLNEEKDTAEQGLKTAQETNRDLLAKISSCEQQLASNEAKICDIRNAEIDIASEAIEKFQKDDMILNLYRNVTQTHWDIKTDEVLQGIIKQKSKLDQPFSFNLSTTSEKYIRDQLWEKLNCGAGSTFLTKS